MAFAQLKSSDVVCIIAPQKSIWTTLFPLWKIFFYFSIIVSGMIPLAVKFKVLIWQILLYQGKMKVLYRFSIFISVFFLLFIFQFYFFWYLAFIRFHILFFFWMYLPALTIWTCALIKVLPFFSNLNVLNSNHIVYNYVYNKKVKFIYKHSLRHSQNIRHWKAQNTWLDCCTFVG